MEDRMEVLNRFINTTSSHIFLTGKAGTGKTTFLKSLAGKTHKNFIVVAPTGIAALNAGGVTIHSQFLLPPILYIPERDLTFEGAESGQFINSTLLGRKYPLNSARKQVLRSIDLLVIDEVSMLRADLLDAMDYRLRAARGNHQQSFGGIQILFIGDLFQLAPIIRNEERKLFQKYYASDGFYAAKALEKIPLIYIELNKVFRQKDSQFIELLNRLRNNTAGKDDIEILNQYYKSPEEIRQTREVITLTTHNHKADSLNLSELKSLTSPLYIFPARIENDFPESIFPVQFRLELKVGAQIMFIRNDNEGQHYFNGKLAVIEEIKGEDIWVILAESHTRFKLKRERWENKKYSLNSSSGTLDEEIIGSFEQFPVKLAWAITIHKSQGLSFDKAVVDLGNAFADGQVYVALSRLRSLDGLILQTHIHASGIRVDHSLTQFVQSQTQPDQLLTVLKQHQNGFIRSIIEKTFDFHPLIKELEYVHRDIVKKGGFEVESMKPLMVQLENSLRKESTNTFTFRTQLLSLLDTNSAFFIERAHKGCAYYKNQFLGYLELVLHHLVEIKKVKRVKAYTEKVLELEQAFSKKMEELDTLGLLSASILNGEDNFNFQSLIKQRIENRKNLIERIQIEFNSKGVAREESPQMGISLLQRNKPSQTNSIPKKTTLEISLEMLQEGHSLNDIAKIRELSPTTIESHMAQAIALQKISVYKFLEPEQLDEIKTKISTMPQNFTLKELYEKMEGKFGYGLIKAALAFTKLPK